MLVRNTGTFYTDDSVTFKGTVIKREIGNDELMTHCLQEESLGFSLCVSDNTPQLESLSLGNALVPIFILLEQIFRLCPHNCGYV